ncbi:hypothetical protein TNCV_4169051 [Trichonephila clavipes]|nr:hypothetical protein TNCV_4169051 [Trichonephila clavipes]
MNSLTEEILQLLNRSDSKLSDLSDDDYAAGNAYERRILKGELSSEKKHGNIYYLKTTLDHSVPTKSLESINFIVIAEANSWFYYKQDIISN